MTIIVNIWLLIQKRRPQAKSGVWYNNFLQVIRIVWMVCHFRLIQMNSSDGDDHINVDDYDGDDGEEVDEDV